jgi:hypothetical protein
MSLDRPPTCRVLLANSSSVRCLFLVQSQYAGQLVHFGIGPVLQLYLGHVDGALVETMTKVAAAIELIILAVSYLLLPKLETLCIQRSTPKRFRGAPLSGRHALSNRSQI